MRRIGCTGWQKNCYRSQRKHFILYTGQHLGQRWPPLAWRLGISGQDLRNAYSPIPGVGNARVNHIPKATYSNVNQMLLRYYQTKVRSIQHDISNCVSLTNIPWLRAACNIMHEVCSWFIQMPSFSYYCLYNRTLILRILLTTLPDAFAADVVKKGRFIKGPSELGLNCVMYNRRGTSTACATTTWHRDTYNYAYVIHNSSCFHCRVTDGNVTSSQEQRVKGQPMLAGKLPGYGLSQWETVLQCNVVPLAESIILVTVNHRQFTTQSLVVYLPSISFPLS